MVWDVLHCGVHLVMDIMKSSSGSLRAADLGDVKNMKGKIWWDDKDSSALEIAREGNKTEAVSLLERFIANQHRPVMKFV